MSLAQIRLAQAQLTLEHLRNLRDRLCRLVNHGAASVEEYEKAEYDFRHQELEVEALKAEMAALAEMDAEDEAAEH